MHKSDPERPQYLLPERPMNARMLLVFLFLICRQVATPANDSSSLCRAPRVIERFVLSTHPMADTSLTSYRAFMPQFLGCLKTWAEDGGESDGVPMNSWIQKDRLEYKSMSVYLIGLLYREYTVSGPPDPVIASQIRALAPWIRTRVKKWPEKVQLAAFITLGELGDKEALPILFDAARTVGSNTRYPAWCAILKLSPESVRELEEMAQTEEELTKLINNISSCGRSSQFLYEARERAKQKLIEIQRGKR